MWLFNSLSFVNASEENLLTGESLVPLMQTGPSVEISVNHHGGREHVLFFDALLEVGEDWVLRLTRVTLHFVCYACRHEGQGHKETVKVICLCMEWTDKAPDILRSTPQNKLSLSVT